MRFSEGKKIDIIRGCDEYENDEDIGLDLGSSIF